MDILSRLEAEVHGLADKIRALESRLREEGEKCSALQEENRTLRLALDSEKERRGEALARINALSDRIEARVGAGKVL